MWIIIGVLFFTLVISLIFLLINKCISNKVDQYQTKSHQKQPEFHAKSSFYHPNNLEEDLPPLPPRTQFETCPEAESYESLDEAPDYVTINDEVVVSPPYSHTMKSRDLDMNYDRHSVYSEDYDDVGKYDDKERDQSEEDYDDVG